MTVALNSHHFRRFIILYGFDAQKYTPASASSITHIHMPPMQRKLKSIVLKAEGKGISMAETFGVFDKNGSGYITASELEEGLRDLGVFQDISREQV